MENLHLIVGLGNPGAEFAVTRHNAGFMVLDRLLEFAKARWKNDRKFSSFQARVGGFVGGDVLLCKPQTFMNASGEAVAPLVRFYRIALTRCLVVVDDADLPVGHIRLRTQGSSGGHHGLESIEQQLGTQDFPRLRIGIGRQSVERAIVGHVLGRFSKTEMAVLDKVLDTAVRQIECWIQYGIQKAMNQFNGAAACPDNEGNEQ